MLEPYCFGEYIIDIVLDDTGCNSSNSEYITAIVDKVS